MSRAAWAAIITAIAFPTIALVVVLLARPGPPPGPHGAPPPPRHAKHGPPPGTVPPEVLVKLRRPLELTDDQVDRIWDIIEPTRRRAIELQSGIEEKEGQLAALLLGDDPDEKAVEAMVEELTALHAERAKLDVLTPLRVRKVLTPEQRTKLMEIWKERPPGPPPGKKRGAMHPGPGKQPPHKKPLFQPHPDEHPPQKQPPFAPPPGQKGPPPPAKTPDFE